MSFMGRDIHFMRYHFNVWFSYLHYFLYVLLIQCRHCFFTGLTALFWHMQLVQFMDLRLFMNMSDKLCVLFISVCNYDLDVNMDSVAFWCVRNVCSTIVFLAAWSARLLCVDDAFAMGWLLRTYTIKHLLQSLTICCMFYFSIYVPFLPLCRKGCLQVHATGDFVATPDREPCPRVVMMD